MDVSPLVWGLTLAFIAALVLFDLLVVQRNDHEVSVKEAGIASLAWTLLGVAFGLVILLLGDTEDMGEYFAGYTLERTLSVDNVFVFVLILGYFAVPPVLQGRALLWGVVIALALRGVFIALGAALLDRFEWTVFVFGAILIYSAWKLAKGGDEEVEPEHNAGLRLLRRFMPVSNDYQGHKLKTKLPDGKWAVTPLFAVLVVIGTTDIVFAVDSVPAIFAVTRDTFIVFTANAFSLLGLRPLAFLLAGVMDRFIYLKPALALVLAIVGLKMVGTGFHVHVNTWVSLGVIAAIIGTGIAMSILKTRTVTQTENIDEQTKDVMK